MDELKQIFEDQARRAIPSGSSEIELVKFDHQSKTMHFKYKHPDKMKKQKASVTLIFKT